MGGRKKEKKGRKKTRESRKQKGTKFAQACADRYTWRCSYLVVELAVDRLPILVHHLECVRSIAIHVAIAIRNATVTEQDGHLRQDKRRRPEKEK